MLSDPELTEDQAHDLYDEQNLTARPPSKNDITRLEKLQRKAMRTPSKKQTEIDAMTSKLESLSSTKKKKSLKKRKAKKAALLEKEGEVAFMSSGVKIGVPQSDIESIEHVYDNLEKNHEFDAPPTQADFVEARRQQQMTEDSIKARNKPTIQDKIKNSHMGQYTMEQHGKKINTNQ